MNAKTILAGCALAPLTLVALGQVGGAPQLREGLWTIHTVMTTNPGNKVSDGTVTMCRNHAYDDYARQLATKHTECTIKQTFAGNKLTSDGTCKVGASTLATKAVVTMSGDTASHTESHTTYTPPAYGTSDSTMIQDQKYVGACPADMQPGDRKSADGTLMHGWKH